MATIVTFGLTLSLILVAFANIGLLIDDLTWRRRYKEIAARYAECMKERR